MPGKGRFFNSLVRLSIYLHYQGGFFYEVLEEDDGIVGCG